MKIGVIGLGFVGLSLASVLASKKYSVIGIDSDKAKVTKINSGKIPFYEPKLEKTLKLGLKQGLKISSDLSLVLENCKMIFITVGTPTAKNGSIDLSMIRSLTKKIGKFLKQTTNQPIIIIKSTVVPGTTTKHIIPILEKESRKKAGKQFAVVTNPEFLREGRAVDDTLTPHIVVLGGNNDKFMKILKKFYCKFHYKVPITITNYPTAEMIKYANNSFLATKISFINQIANICEAIPETNVEDVAKTIGLDPRIGNLFLSAGPGFGGSCLPKDLKAIINFSSEVGVKPTLFDAIQKVNQYQIKNIVSHVEKMIGKIQGKTITILGLSFKPVTDDIRNSMSIELIKLLLGKKAKIKVHDPKAIENTRLIFANKIIYANSISEALENSECAIIMTSWKQYTTLSKKELKFMKKKIIVDSRRLLTEHKLDAEYHGVGIGKK